MENSKYGKWHVDTEHKGTEDDPIQMPFVGYERIVIDLEHAIYDFVDTHPEMELTKYSEVLEQNGLEWGIWNTTRKTPFVPIPSDAIWKSIGCIFHQFLEK